MALAQLAHYEIREEIGHGGMGVVYLAHDTRLQRKVAIKVLPEGVSTDPERRSRLQREARAAAQLNHPNIAVIYEVGEAELEEKNSASSSCLYIAMEYVEGQDLDQRLKSGELPMEETLELGLQISSGLEAAHRAGVVHRDLKPHNIRITPEGTAKILDFGLAKMVQGDSLLEEMPVAEETILTSEGMIVGTVPYMAPEQIEGKGVDSRCDLFSFGVVLYQMITGRLPFAGGNLVQFLKNLANTEPEPISSSNPEVSRELEGIVGRLLAKNPEERYQSAAEVRTDLELLFGGSLPSFAQPETEVMSWRQRWTHGLPLPSWLPWAAAGLLAIIAAGLWLRSLPAPQEDGPLTILPLARPAIEASPLCQELDRFLEEGLTRQSGVVMLAPIALGSTDLRQEDVRRQYRGNLALGTRCSAAAGEEAAVEVNLIDIDSGLNLLAKTIRLPAPGQPREDLQQEILYQVSRALGLASMGRGLPNETLTAFYEGQRLLDNYRERPELTRAILAFEGIVKSHPGFAPAYSGLSEAIARRHGRNISRADLDRAEASARRALELDPNLAEGTIALARTLRLKDADELSAQLLRDLLTSQPEHDRAHYELGITLRDLEDSPAATQSYLNAIRLRPGHWRYHHQLASQHFQVQNFDRALQAFTAAAERAPEGVLDPIHGAVQLELLAGRFDDAVNRIETIPAHLHTAALANSLAGAHYYLADWPQAEAAYLAAAALDDGEPSTWSSLAEVQRQLGKATDAQAAAERALTISQTRIERDPDNAHYQAWHATYLAGSGRCKEALPLAQQLTVTEPDDAQDLVALARAHNACGQATDARALLDRAIARGFPRVLLSRELGLGNLL